MQWDDDEPESEQKKKQDDLPAKKDDLASILETKAYSRFSPPQEDDLKVGQKREYQKTNADKFMDDIFQSDDRPSKK